MKADLLKQFPFLEYASQFILRHADAAARKFTQQEFISEFPLPDWIRIFNIFEKHKIRKYSQEADILYILADRGHPNLIRIRLEIIPGVDGGGGRYRHPLLAAMAKGNKDSVIALLGLSSSIHNGINITDGLKCKLDSVRKDHMPFSWACEEGYTAIAKILLHSGITATEADLARVIKNGHSDIVKMLLDKGVDASAADKDGLMPLHLASQNCHLEIAEMLLDKGADASAADKDGWTPLYLASQNGYLEIVKMLLDKGADTSAANKGGWMPLHQASHNGYSEIVKMLLDKGADASAADKYGRTPLYLASQNGYLEIVKMLLDKGADASAADKYRKTPLHRASKNGHLEIVKMLLDEGEDASAANEDGLVPSATVHN